MTKGKQRRGIHRSDLKTKGWDVESKHSEDFTGVTFWVFFGYIHGMFFQNYNLFQVNVGGLSRMSQKQNKLSDNDEK